MQEPLLLMRIPHEPTVDRKKKHLSLLKKRASFTPLFLGNPPVSLAINALSFFEEGE